MTTANHGKHLGMLTKHVLRAGLGYLFLGRLRVKSGHIPPCPHLVAEDFIGVCVASNENPAVDDYVVAQVRALGLSRVRLDMTYGDLDNHTMRFLKRLLAEGLSVTVHAIQPFESARHMHETAHQETWRAFLRQLLAEVGTQIAAVEIGSTINRKRWAGYNWQGFMQAWDIAHTLIKGHGVPLIGPSVQDFEPFYNIGLLHTLQGKQQLPDMHSDNLFAERTVEPERFDHRIFKYHWAKWFRYNLVKKARLLQKIGQDFGVKSTVSSVAFWAIYRIQRLLPNGEQKQADYAARYFLLLAASGALRHANWGALICQREGLISDGLSEADYPALERVTHYARADGHLQAYRVHPSFDAVKTVATMVHGAEYRQPIATAQGLEIHAFKRGDTYFHVAWAINGYAYYLGELYTSATLTRAHFFNRDGESVDQPALITEAPLYVCWDARDDISVATAKPIRLHAHVAGQRYIAYQQDGWKGLLLASDTQEVAQMLQFVRPDKLQAPGKEQALRHARNAIWSIADPRKSHQGQYLTVKQPQKMYAYKRLFDRFKPSKAQRSWDGAMELMRRGITTAMPVAYFEKIGDTTLKQNFYLCEFIPADFTIAQAFVAFSSGEARFQGLDAEQIYQPFAHFCHTMHVRGVYFRDFSGGNILVKIGLDKALSFSLIDTARLHTFDLSAPFHLRLADLTRALNKLHWPGRVRLMQIYMGLNGRPFSWRARWPFYVYDLKVALKRNVGRKAWRRLFNLLRGQAKGTHTHENHEL